MGLFNLPRNKLLPEKTDKLTRAAKIDF